MFLRKRPLLFLSVILLSTLVIAEECAVEIQNEGKGMHIVMGNCKNIGTFSLGGIYNEKWEKLTYYYPMPWEGTFLTIMVDDKFYTNSMDPEEGIRMDRYLEQYATIEENKIWVKWMLPEDILVEEILEMIENSTLIHVKITNKNPSQRFDVGVRIHIDTMLGDNDGAPIYIPGDGLKETEKEYSGDYLNFKYWKAYNRKDKPNIVATGILDLNGKLTYPDKVTIVNWKKSMRSVWDYKINEEMSILGDSAVMLYYNPRPIGSGETMEIITGYGSGEPVLKNVSGITEIVLNKISGEYCPGEDVVMKVDVGSRVDFQGLLGVEIRNKKGILFYSKNMSTGVIEAESIKSMEFDFTVPEDVSLDEFNISARLYSAGNLIDEKSSRFSVDASRCVLPAEKGPNWFLIALFIIAVSVLIFMVYPKKGRVIIEKFKEGDTVRVLVWNKSKNDLRNCIVEDRIVEGAEVSISTMNVERSGTRLTWNIGTLKSGEKVTLEYRIKDVNVLPRALVRWDGGEEISK